jgi:hypothetical protein
MVLEETMGCLLKINSPVLCGGWMVGAWNNSAAQTERWVVGLKLTVTSVLLKPVGRGVAGLVVVWPAGDHTIAPFANSTARHMKLEQLLQHHHIELVHVCQQTCTRHNSTRRCEKKKEKEEEGTVWWGGEAEHRSPGLHGWDKSGQQSDGYSCSG